MNTKELSLQEKLQILKDIFDSTDIVLTAAYGAHETISGTDIYIAIENIDYCGIHKDITIIISTGIMTG